MSMIIYGSNRKSKETHIFTKEDPLLAERKHRVLLSKEGSSKKTFHLALDISGSSLVYQEGDAVGILPQNPPSILSALFTLLHLPQETMVEDPHDYMPLSLETYLRHKSNLARVTPALLQLLLEHTSSPQHRATLQELVHPDQKPLRAAYIQEHDVLTSLKSFGPPKLPAQAFIRALAPMLPRFYSIASSPTHYPSEIHLLVATFSYSVQNELRSGIASHFLCYSDETTIPIYVQHNPNFRLPVEPQIPIIMIGPGTGVAPYRAFLQKRSATPSRNWLFFGECHKAYDFYYEEELTRYAASGLLKLSTAFSRDQPHKFYVQHAMEQQSKELWSWIQEGAYLYVCGDATHMAKDVHHTLLKIVEEEGSLSSEEAKAFVHQMRKTKRYQTDVY